MKRLPRPKRKSESRKVSEARTRVAVEYVPMTYSKRKRKWIPAPDLDRGERTPSWLTYALAQRAREQRRTK